MEEEAHFRTPIFTHPRLEQDSQVGLVNVRLLHCRRKLADVDAAVAVAVDARKDLPDLLAVLLLRPLGPQAAHELIERLGDDFARDGSHVGLVRAAGCGKEQGARSKEQGARSKEQGARSKAQGARRKEQSSFERRARG